MKKVLVAIYEEKSVIAAFARLGEEEGQRLFDGAIDEEVKKAVGDAAVEVETELPCDEHPGMIYIYAHVEE